MPLTVPEAEEALSKAIAMEQEIASELSAIEKQLAEAESTAGARSLEARKTGESKAIQKINDEIQKLHTQHGIIKSTHQAAREAIKAARHEINMARGRVLRAQAAEIDKQVSTRQKKTDQLLAALLEHEGIRYLPEPQSLGGVYLPGTNAESKTAKLAKEALFLVQQAEITENQIVRVEPDAPTSGRRSEAMTREESDRALKVAAAGGK